MTRKILWAVLAIGIALVIAPFATGLPGKAAAGQRMLNGFQPIMQPQQVQKTAYYYNDVFTPLGRMASMMNAQKPNAVLSQVPPGLAHYKPLVTTMQANVDNFQQVNSLPDFRLFTVFFMVPGALLILLAGFGLFGPQLQSRSWFHHRIGVTPA